MGRQWNGVVYLGGKGAGKSPQNICDDSREEGVLKCDVTSSKLGKYYKAQPNPAGYIETNGYMYDIHLQLL